MAAIMGSARPCWHCEHWGGWAWDGPHSRCTRPQSPGVIAQPGDGCAHWTRQPGTDDELGPPPLPSG